MAKKKEKQEVIGKSDEEKIRKAEEARLSGIAYYEKLDKARAEREK